EPDYTSSLLSFLFLATAATAIYTLSLHDALPISRQLGIGVPFVSRAVMSHVRVLFPWAGSPSRMVIAPNGTRLGHNQCIGSGLRSEEHTSELQSRENLVCRLLLEKKKKKRR